MLLFFCIFSISAVSPTHNNDIAPFKIITGSHCTFTQRTTQLSTGPTISSQFLLVCSFTAESFTNNCCFTAVVSQWLTTDDTQCVLLCVSDSLQLVVMSCFVSVTVCSLLLCPVVCQWQFEACCVCLCVYVCVCVFLCVCVCLCHFFFSTSDPSTLKAVLDTRKQLSNTILGAFHKHKSLLTLNYTQLPSFYNNSALTCFLLFQNTPFSLPSFGYSFDSHLFVTFVKSVWIEPSCSKTQHFHVRSFLWFGSLKYIFSLRVPHPVFSVFWHS